MFGTPQPPRQIYLVESETGLFKLGLSRFPQKRAETICAHSPCRVRLVACWPGEMLNEQAFHGRLDPYRSHHEWFRKEGAAASFFESMFGRGLDRIADWSECDRPTMKSRHKVLSAAAKKKWSDPAYKAARAEGYREVAQRRAAVRAS